MRPRAHSFPVIGARRRKSEDKDAATMNESRSAARLRDTASSIALRKDLAMGRTHAEPAARLRTIWLSGVVGIGLVIVVSLSVDLAASVGRDQSIAAGTSAIVRSHLLAGYPDHHGLAGPSRVGPSAGSWFGYPPHFGLAGPSRVGPDSAPIRIGAGYPPHYGLAGPSQTGSSQMTIGIGVGYPPHYGLAGPSHVDD